MDASHHTNSPQTLAELSHLLAENELNSSTLVDRCLDRIDALNPSINAFVEIDREGSATAAMTLGPTTGMTDPTAKHASRLSGIPIAIKDNICIAGRPTTCGSRMLADFLPPHTATASQQLEKAGAILIGKCNLDEFAMGGSTETSIQGPTHNPWKLTATAGGSSGGSAAAVAAGMVPASLGSDTGGSIRQPASFCGVSGLKPTYGRVSRFGLVAFASSLDQIGPIAHTAEDLALLLDELCQHDPRDSTSLPQAKKPTFHTELNSSLVGLRVGVLRDQLDHDGLDPEVRTSIESALEVYQRAGATLIDIELPMQRHGIAAYYVIATSEASSNLARYDGAHYGFRAIQDENQPLLGESALYDMYCRSRSQGFGEEVRRRILLGTYALSAGYIDAYYLQACRVRRLIRDELNAVFEQVDVLAGPVAPTAAFSLGDNVDEPLAMYLADLFTVGANLAGNPAMSIPCGFTSDQRPIGLQLQSAPLAEQTLLNAGHGYQTAVSYHPQLPPSLSIR
jgi:aspartyl-tRNA(Asn)/glutamyl-tRNA(Gln) amidotransferase subunit A